MSSVRYRQVPQQEPIEPSETEKKRKADRIERITVKIHAFIWVVLAIALAYFTDIIALLQDPEKTNRLALKIAVASFSVVVGIFLYLAVWLPYVMKINVPWEISSPNMIPTATAASVICFISVVCAFWPAWGLLSPLFVGFLTMGLIFLTGFIPWPC